MVFDGKTVVPPSTMLTTGRPAASPVTTTHMAREESAAPAFALFDEPDSGSHGAD